MKPVTTLAAGLVLFAVACGDGNRSEGILHLSGVDMTENELRQILDEGAGYPDLVSGLCSLKSTVELVRWSGNGPLGGENDKGYGSYSHDRAQFYGPGRPRPGQMAESKSKERTYEIVQDWCRAQ